MTDAEALGRVIAVCRTVRGTKRKELAKQAGISYPFLCELETGKKDPSLPTLRAVAAVLDTTPGWLLEAATRLTRGQAMWD